MRLHQPGAAFTAPGTLKPDDVCSLVAFLLARNGAIGATDVMDRTSLPQVLMPNRDGVIVEPEFSRIKR